MPPASFAKTASSHFWRSQIEYSQDWEKVRSALAPVLKLPEYREQGALFWFDDTLAVHCRDVPEYDAHVEKLSDILSEWLDSLEEPDGGAAGQSAHPAAADVVTQMTLGLEHAEGLNSRTACASRSAET